MKSDTYLNAKQKMIKDDRKSWGSEEGGQLYAYFMYIFIRPHLYVFYWLFKPAYVTVILYFGSKAAAAPSDSDKLILFPLVQRASWSFCFSCLSWQTCGFAAATKSFNQGHGNGRKWTRNKRFGVIYFGACGLNRDSAVVNLLWFILFNFLSLGCSVN